MWFLLFFFNGLYKKAWWSGGWWVLGITPMSEPWEYPKNYKLNSNIECFCEESQIDTQ